MSNGVETLAQPAPGSTIAATTTIDAILTSLWGVRSADLAGTPVYTWGVTNPGTLYATWPSATTPTGQCAQIIIRFEPHPQAPTTIGPT
jgi:hypothetical protein